MTSIDRRMLLTRGAIGGAALTLTSGAALASVSEDAEVIRRGNECLGQFREDDEQSACLPHVSFVCQNRSGSGARGC